MKNLAKTNKWFLWLIFGLIFFTACEKQLDMPQNFMASQGDYMGIIHLTWDVIPDAQYYNVERRLPDGTWMNAGTVSTNEMDDFGLGLADNKLSPGTHYTYRVSAASSDISDSEFAEFSNEGWCYEIKPIELKATSLTETTNLITWIDPNIDQVKNLFQYNYKISSGYNNVPDYTYSFVTITDYNSPKLEYTDYAVSSTNTLYYAIDAYYNYSYMDLNGNETTAQLKRDWQGESVALDSGESPTDTLIAYSSTDLGTIINDGSVFDYTKLKVYDGVPYVGLLGGTQNGIVAMPQLYKLNGSSWVQAVDNYPLKFQSPDFINMDFEILNNEVYIAAYTNDTLWLYSNSGGQWSNTLISGSLATEYDAQIYSLASFNNELYLSLYNSKDNKLSTWKYSNNDWQLIGNSYTPANGKYVSELHLKVLNNQLYLSYLIQNSESNATLTIKSLSGSSWTNHLVYTADYLTTINLAVNNSSEVFFSSSSLNIGAWLGAVFKVVSSDNAEEITPQLNNWILTPDGLSTDQDGNLVVSYTSYISQTEVYPSLAVFENAVWKKMDYDFSAGASPSNIEYSNNSVFYVFGEAATQNSNYQTTVLKAVKFSK